MRKSRSVYLSIIFLLALFSFNSCQNKNLFFEEAGEGETIIFVHGSQEDYRVFLPQLEYLKQDFRIITYSRRYNYPNNNNFKKNIPFNPMTEAEDLEVLIKRIGVDKFHIVGHSYGGLIALAFANNNSDKLKSIVLSEPPLLKLKGCEKSLEMTNDELIKKVREAFKTKDSTRIMKSIFEFFAGKDIQNDVPPEVLTSLKANLTEMEALVNSKNPFPDLNTKFDIPMMIFTSEYTMPVLKCTNEALINNTLNASHILIPDASHDMWMSHHEVMANHLKKFISQN